MPINQIYKIFRSSKGVSIDSREDLSGKIFFAIKGERFDGNRFAADAVKNGALCAIVDDVSLEGEQFITVPDSIRALQQLAHRYRQEFTIPFLAITGSNGKTTTKELVHAVLKTEKIVFATKGNFNNHLGVPLTILSIPLDCEFAIIEMGANLEGEIAELCQIAAPNYGLITNVGRAHLEGFGSFEGVKRAKSELYRYLEKNKGLYFISSQDEDLKNLAQKANSIYYQVLPHKQNEKSYSVEWNGIQIKSNLAGSYNVLNISAAVAIGNYFKILDSNIECGIEGYVPTNNRSELIQTENNQIILDAYNANPSSMQCSLRDFANMNVDDKLVILGGMKELGSYEKEEHIKLLESIKTLDPLMPAILIGQEFQNLTKGHRWFKDTEELIQWLKGNPISKRSILIKGSRSNQLEKIVAFL